MVDLVIEIDGRKAIPVRALPWMTGWHFGANEVAEALSGDGCGTGIPFTTAYRLKEDGAKHGMPKHFWVDVTQSLEQAEDAELLSKDWHAVATGLLPEGVWVWADEWSTAYDSSPDGPGQLGLIAETTEDLQDIESRLLQQEPYVPPELLEMLIAGFNELAALAKPEVESAPQAVPVVQSGPSAPLPARRHTRTGWKDGPAFDYAAKQFAQHGPFQAKALIACLKKNTDPGSPFEVRGGVLTVRATGQALQDKTIENSMATIRDRAKELKALQG